MSYNVPDDWNMYYYRCSECGDYYHASGSEECSCPPPEEDDDER